MDTELREYDDFMSRLFSVDGVVTQVPWVSRIREFVGAFIHWG
jgi:hypothetical protein